jgi:hypothetical protein
MTTKYPHTQDIKKILKDKSESVRQDGLNYLIPRWHLFAEKYADTESSIYEWLNDLDTRNIIDEILSILSDKDKTSIIHDLKEIDDRVIKKTFEVNECVWGDKVEKENGFDRYKNWYFYRINEKVFNNEPAQFTKRL